MNTTLYKKNIMQCPEPAPTFWPVTTFWTVSDVQKYVCDLGLEKYRKCFTENAITGKDLQTMNVFDLQRLGVANMEEAMYLSAHIHKVTTTTMSNPAVQDVPPNLSYCSGYNSSIVPNGTMKLPPLADVNNLRLPFRDPGDRIYRYKLPVQSYHDHCMVLGRTDAWKMYNSKF